jgi:hypothetical protein
MPFVLEKYNIRLWLIYIDNILEIILKLPMNFAYLLLKYIIRGKKPEVSEYYIITHFLLVLIPFLILTENLYFIDLKEYFVTSYWYHAFRV